MNWRAPVVGFFVVLATTVAAVLGMPLLLVVSGFLGGLATGYLAGGVWSGLGYGLLVGVVFTALGVGAGWWLMTSTTTSHPDAGMFLLAWWFVIVANGVEVVFGGLVGGGIARLRSD